jgi:hypothetical protein
VERALTPDEFRAVWERKPVLRAVYGEHYRFIATWARPGRTVEIGAGAGNLNDGFCTVPGSARSPTRSRAAIAPGASCPNESSSR